MRGDFSREMRADEVDAVHALLCAAFETDAEARLVASLRKSKAIAGEMVLPLDGRIAGYYALSYLVKPKGWLALAPVAIDPAVQRQKFGKRMIGMLSEWARLSHTPVVVLGNPDFYEKTGFDRELAANLSSPYPIENTMVVGVKQALTKTLVYPDAFKDM